MKPVARPAYAGKWEVLRRLRYGDVLKLIRSRYGAVPPDDDAGRPDVMELLFLASMAPTGAEEKVRHAIDLYAPWMPTDEVEITHSASFRHASLPKGADSRGAWSPAQPQQYRTRAAEAVAHKAGRYNCRGACPTSEGKRTRPQSHTAAQARHPHEGRISRRAQKQA